MRVSYYALGCKVNLYESEAVINQFVEKGFDLVKFNDESDVYIINTCTITQASDSKSRKMIRQAVRRNPNAVIAVMGCYAQLNSDEVAAIDGVDIVVGTHRRIELYDLVAARLTEQSGTVLVEDITKVKDYEEIKIKRYHDKTRGFVKIQDGCNNFCTYCRIPYARGRVRSRLPQDVLDEISVLTAQGMKEIVLTGINTASFGKDLENYDFSDLLVEIFRSIPNTCQIRISSIEVTEINDKLLRVLKDNIEKFCMHLHMPLQSGSDCILALMGRKYNTDYYWEKVSVIRNTFPNINITTDIMVGFSGETEALFDETYRFIKKVGFGEMHIFPYSKRPLTKAFDFNNQVDEATKNVRVSKLLELNKRLALEYRQSFLGSIENVLVEKVIKGIAYGHTSHYLQVTFPGKVQANDRIEVMLIDIDYPITKGVFR